MELLNIRKFQEMWEAAFENASDTLRENYLLGKNLSCGDRESGPSRHCG